MKKSEVFLNNVVRNLCNETGYVNNRKEAIEKGKPTFISLSGGMPGRVTLREIDTQRGTAEYAFNLGAHAYSIATMTEVCHALIAGIKYGKELKK